MINLSDKQQTLKKILRHRISAIIRTENQQLAADAMEAAISGGFQIIEFTLTTPGAFELISGFSGRPDNLVVGAGTVMTPEDATMAVDSGAQFLVSPVCDREVITRARELKTIVIPGTFTASEMSNAYCLGADLVKLFPAPANLVQYISFLLGPMPYLKIFPTAGVDIHNMIDVLNAGAAGIGFVGSLFHPENLKTRNFSAIENMAADIHHVFARLNNT